MGCSPRVAAMAGTSTASPLSPTRRPVSCMWQAGRNPTYTSRTAMPSSKRQATFLLCDRVMYRRNNQHIDCRDHSGHHKIHNTLSKTYISHGIYHFSCLRPDRYSALPSPPLCSQEQQKRVGVIIPNRPYLNLYRTTAS